MDSSLTLILPFCLMLARVSAFVAVLPLFSWQTVPTVVKVGMAMLLTVFLSTLVPVPSAVLAHVTSVTAIVLVVQEAVLGLVLGLAANMIFLGVQQGARLIAQQMGLTDAEIMDPVTGEGSDSMSQFFEMTFALLFLVAGGHHVLLYIVTKSYEVFPVGQMPQVETMAKTIIEAGAVMLLLAVKLAAPMLAAFLVLAVVLALISRLLPEMNILMASFPLRIGLGLFIAASIMPLMGAFTQELAGWMGKLITKT